MSGFAYAKVANLLLYYRIDPRWGFLYLLVITVQGLLLPEPTYAGPEKITILNSATMAEELKNAKTGHWLILLYTAWSPSSNAVSPMFSKISANYSSDAIKFGKTVRKTLSIRLA